MSEDDNRLLAELAVHPGWAVLEERVKKDLREASEDLAKALIFSRAPVDQERVTRARAFWDGQKWFLRQVKQGLRKYQEQEGLNVRH